MKTNQRERERERDREKSYTYRNISSRRCLRGGERDQKSTTWWLLESKIFKGNVVGGKKNANVVGMIAKGGGTRNEGRRRRRRRRKRWRTVEGAKGLTDGGESLRRVYHQSYRRYYTIGISFSFSLSLPLFLSFFQFPLFLWLFVFDSFLPSALSSLAHSTKTTTKKNEEATKLGNNNSSLGERLNVKGVNKHVYRVVEKSSLSRIQSFLDYSDY